MDLKKLHELPRKDGNAFNYYYERKLEPDETVIVKIPDVSPNARGVNDIAYICDESVKVYGTIDRDIHNPNALWQEILMGEDVNKTVSAMKFVNGNQPSTVFIRVILY